jgi:hypothetical protein
MGVVDHTGRLSPKLLPAIDVSSYFSMQNDPAAAFEIDESAGNLGFAKFRIRQQTVSKGWTAYDQFRFYENSRVMRGRCSTV